MPLRWSPSRVCTSVSNIGTSMACPVPVRSRISNAAMAECAAVRPVMRSAIVMGTNTGSLSPARTNRPATPLAA
ncbi:hypothetical protein D3C78_1919740 [compost metagenome]